MAGPLKARAQPRRRDPHRRPARRVTGLLGNPVVLAAVAVATAFGAAYGMGALVVPRADAVPAPSEEVVGRPAGPAPGLGPVDPALTRLAAMPDPVDPAARVPAVPALPPPLPPEPAPPPDGPPGAPLWMRNAVPSAAPADRPVLAVVIDDMGLDRKRSARVVRLPGPLTLSWLPYAADLPEQARAARVAGHELMLHMPMEPVGSADPGPDALRVGLETPELLRRLDAALGRFEGYIGVNNHMGSRFTADAAGMAPVLADLKRRGLVWLDSRTTPRTVGPGLARDLRMPHVGRDVFLDNEQSAAAVRVELARLEGIARRSGAAIAIGHPHDATIEALAAWLPDVQKRGFALVPVSAIVKARHAGG